VEYRGCRCDRSRSASGPGPEGWDASRIGSVPGLPAYLSTSHLNSADLWSADLTNADLWAADLTSADLRNANPTGAKLAEAKLSLVDLTGARWPRDREIPKYWIADDSAETADGVVVLRRAERGAH
jgi:hypothetical protein